MISYGITVLICQTCLKKSPCYPTARAKTACTMTRNTGTLSKKSETLVMGETQKGNRNPNPVLKNIEFCFVCLFFFF